MMKTSRFSNAIGKCGGIFGILWNKIQRELQYEFLPGFYTICKEWETRGIWHRFCKKAAEAGEVCDLPPHLLFALSLQSALNIAFKCKHFAHKSSMVMLESVIDRTWCAIQK